MNVLVRVVQALLGGLGVAIVVGALVGALARVGMRLFAIAGGAVTDFSWEGTLFIASAFAFCALPSALAGAATRYVPVRVLAYVASTVLLTMIIVPTGADEWARTLARGVDGAQIVLLCVITAGFVALVLAQPFAADRLASSLVRVPVAPKDPSWL